MTRAKEHRDAACGKNQYAHRTPSAHGEIHRPLSTHGTAKRILSLLTGAVLLAGAVLAVQPPLTARAAGHIKFDEDEGASYGGMSWNGSTLTLNDVNYVGQLDVPDGATIVVQGDNYVTMNGVYDDTGAICGQGDLTITGGGSLHVLNQVPTGDKCYAIMAKGKLTIRGVSIEATADSPERPGLSAGIMSREEMRINGAVVAAGSGNATGSSVGIRCTDNLMIDGGSIVAANGLTFGLWAFSDGLFINSGNVTAIGGIKAKVGIALAPGALIDMPAGGYIGEKASRWYIMNPATGRPASVAHIVTPDMLAVPQE